MSAVDSRPGTIASVAVEYATVTEMVALQVARFEGSGDPERAYTLAMETFGEGLGNVSTEGKVAILREERLDERGRVRAPKSRPGALGVGDVLGSGEPRVDLAVEPIEGLQLLARGQEGDPSRPSRQRRGARC